MNPDPSIRTRCGAVPVAAAGRAATSMSAGVAGSRVQYVEPRAVRAHDLLALDVQEDARVAQRAVPAVAGDSAVIDVNDFRGGGGAVRHVNGPCWMEPASYRPRGRAPRRPARLL